MHTTQTLVLACSTAGAFGVLAGMFLMDGLRAWTRRAGRNR